MSVRIMAAVWLVKLPDSEKLVLLALADCANDEGGCWPSMATLADKCSKSDRTVQASIKSLCAAGHLTRNEKPGKGVDYTVHPRSDCTPEVASPPKRTTPTPEAASDKPSRTINHQVSLKPSGRAREKLPGHWHRLPADWQPQILPEPTQAKADQWPPGKLKDELANLKTWAANAEHKQGKGLKLDWDMAWWQWIARAHNDWMGQRGAGRLARSATDSPGIGRTQQAADRLLAKIDARMG